MLRNITGASASHCHWHIVVELVQSGVRALHCVLWFRGTETHIDAVKGVNTND